MSVIAVTRHPAIRKWLARQGVWVDHFTDHLEIDRIQPGDTVIGTLPVHLAAEVRRRGGRHQHLALELPPEARGKELGADDMERATAPVWSPTRCTPVGGKPATSLRLKCFCDTAHRPKAM